MMGARTWRVIAGLLCVGLLAIGGRTIFEATTSGAQRSVTYEQLVREGPSVGWVAVEDGSFDLGEAVVATRGRRRQWQVYVPLRRAGAPAGERPQLLVRIADADLAQRLDRQPEPPGTRRNAQGTITWPATDDGVERELTERFGIEEPDRLVVIDLGRRPAGVVPGLLMIVAGLAIGGFMLWSLRRRSRAGH